MSIIPVGFGDQDEHQPLSIGHCDLWDYPCIMIYFSADLLQNPQALIWKRGPTLQDKQLYRREIVCMR